MTKLTQLQLDLLTAAAEPEGGLAMPDPRPAALASLIRKGFAMVLPMGEGPDRILVTDAGRAALPAASDQEPSGAPLEPNGDAGAERALEGAQAAREGPSAVAGPKGKLGLLVALLRRSDGATTSDIMAATGWQAHSVRGAIAGAVKKKLGLAVMSEKIDGARVYRIADEVGE